MTKTHLIPDESLGGVLREYIEVDRKAVVGDYVTRDGIIREVEKRSDVCDGVEFEPYLDDDGEDTIGWTDGYYKTLEPTDIIHVDGKRYRMVERKANVGDKVIVIKSPVIKPGTIGNCIENSAYYDGLITIDTPFYDDDYTFINTDLDKYRVLEPLLSPEELCGYFDGDDADNQPTDQLDIIARLTRKVAQLERENTDIKRDIETWAQEVERLKRKLDDDRRDIEMVIDDIVTLDERTRPEEMAKKLAEVITKGLNASY